MHNRKLLCGLVACLTISTLGWGREVEPLKIGDRAPDFKLPGVDGETHSLDQFSAAKLLVVIFTCNHCPTAQAYEQRIIDLHAEYSPRGVAFVADRSTRNLAKSIDTRAKEIVKTVVSDPVAVIRRIL